VGCDGDGRLTEAGRGDLDDRPVVHVLVVHDRNFDHDREGLALVVVPGVARKGSHDYFTSTLLAPTSMLRRLPSASTAYIVPSKSRLSVWTLSMPPIEPWSSPRYRCSIARTSFDFGAASSFGVSQGADGACPCALGFLSCTGKLARNASNASAF